MGNVRKAGKQLELESNGGKLPISSIADVDGFEKSVWFSEDAMTKVPWRGMDNAGEVFIATRPGQCVSVDQMISTQVGFIAQLKDSLTKQLLVCDQCV